MTDPALYRRLPEQITASSSWRRVFSLPKLEASGALTPGEGRQTPNATRHLASLGPSFRENASEGRPWKLGVARLWRMGLPFMLIQAK